MCRVGTHKCTTEARGSPQIPKSCSQKQLWACNMCAGNPLVLCKAGHSLNGWTISPALLLIFKNEKPKVTLVCNSFVCQDSYPEKDIHRWTLKLNGLDTFLEHSAVFLSWEGRTSWEWWCTPITSAFMRLRQEELEFKIWLAALVPT